MSHNVPSCRWDIPGPKCPNYMSLILTSSNCHTGNFNRAHQDFKGGCSTYLGSLKTWALAKISHEQDPSRYSIPFSQFTWRFSYDKKIYWLVASCTSNDLSWECRSRLSGAKGYAKASFSRRGSDELFPSLLETHITYFIWVQHILPSHSISGWICYSLSSFFPTSKYVQEWTGSECSYQHL